ncbi:hypothetical protein [Undibacterium sp. Di24W]|uniref:hypothetical protein n=1 Tax=Undibacterium sp. Di24W TaxID=3413033 RepID=UPI003BF0D492
MIGRRNSPDGLPFRLYVDNGKFKVSYYYKLPSGKRAFTLSASVNNPDAIAKAKAEAIEQANELNGNTPKKGTIADLIKRYFAWQSALKLDDVRRKARSTLEENAYESKNIDKVFGKMSPEAIKAKHIYGYLAVRADGGAPAKANKEVALFSAILEYGRTRGELETNPCRGIKYNKTKPSTKLVNDEQLEFAIDEARKRGGQYVVLALCFYVAYLTTSRPDEMRGLLRTAKTAEGLKIPVGKRRADQAQKYKIIQWSPKLEAAIEEALRLQRTSSMLVFGNTDGQEYTRSGWGTIWRRLMTYCEKRAEVEGIEFERFSLKDMRPKSVTQRVQAGESNIINSTGHADERMIRKTYDRSVIKRANSTE